MALPTPREQRLARWVFWSLTVVMLALIYRDLWSGVWEESVATGERWWRQLLVAVEPVATKPAPKGLPVAEPSPPADAKRAPQTVGDVIANLQQGSGAAAP